MIFKSHDDNISDVSNKLNSISSTKGPRVRNIIKFPVNVLSHGNPYSHYFDECGYCRNVGRSKKLEINYGFDCEYLSLPKLNLYFDQDSVKKLIVGSKEAIRYKMTPNSGNMGTNRYVIWIDKKTLTCSAISCIMNKCDCKYKCIPNVIVTTFIRYFDCNELRKFGDRIELPYLDSNKNKKNRTLDYYEGENADCICNAIKDAILEHEKLHCAQYNREVKKLFKSWGAGNILKKICLKMKKYKCENDSIEKCEKQLVAFKNNFRQVFSSQFAKALRRNRSKRENQAFDYGFIKFNEFYNRCLSNK